MKIDIRILALSLAFHFAFYFLMGITFQTPTPRTDIVEIDFIDSTRSQQTMNTVKQPKVQETSTDEPAAFVSDSQTRFKKQMVSKNLGVPQNIQRPAQNSLPSEAQEPSPSTSGFLPVPTTYRTNEDPRRSAVPFEVPHLAKGDFTFLNSDFSTYATFYARITPRIVFNWGQNVQEISMFPHMIEKLSRKQRWTTSVELVLNSKGHFEDVIVVRTSGADELDAAVVQSLKDSGPFLNPPSGMIESDGRVRIQAEFTVYTQRPRWAK